MVQRPGLWTHGLDRGLDYGLDHGPKIDSILGDVTITKPGLTWIFMDWTEGSSDFVTETM